MASRIRAANSLAAVHQKRLEQKGPVRKALHKLLTESVEPETAKAIADVERTKQEYDEALEVRASGQTEELDNLVRKTWVAAQAAPAVRKRMVDVVLPRMTALVDSDDALALDDLLGNHGRDAFMVALDAQVGTVRALATQLGIAIKALEASHQEHAAHMGDIDARAKTLNRDARSLVPSFDLTTALARGTLETADVRVVRFAAARAIKTSLRTTLGSTAARYIDTLLTVNTEQ